MKRRPHARDRHPTQHWRDLRWRTRLAVALLRGVAHLPLAWQLPIGRLLGACVYLGSPHRRHVASVNIELCFPSLSPGARRRLVRDTFTSVGIGAVETAIAFSRPPERYRDRVTMHGLEHLRAAQALGHGVLVLGAHFTTLDLAGALLSLFTELDVVYRANRNPMIEHVVRDGRERLYAHVIERRDLRSAVRSLRSGRTLWYAPDQDYGRAHSVFAPFFGVPAATITMPSRLARLSGARTLVMTHFRDVARRRWSVHFTEVLDGFPSGDTVADATRVNRLIEEAVRHHPEQYLWLHRRFKTRPPGESRPYRPAPRRQRRSSSR